MVGINEDFDETQKEVEESLMWGHESFSRLKRIRVSNKDASEAPFRKRQNDCTPGPAYRSGLVRR